MSSATTTLPSRRRIVFVISLACACAIFLWFTVFVSNSIEGRYQQDSQHIRLVAVEGQLYAFDRGEHPEIDGYTYDDPGAAASTIAEWKRTHTRMNIWDRHKALPVHHEDPGHDWVESFDTLELEVVPARIEGLGITLPWLRVVTMEYSFGLRDHIERLAGLPIVPTGRTHPAIDYLRRHIPDSGLADRLALGVHTYPRLELEPRFVWLPLAQFALLVVISILLTLGWVWALCRWSARFVASTPAPKIHLCQPSTARSR